jgi:NADH-quinone oxidoreductase subunit M
MLTVLLLLIPAVAAILIALSGFTRIIAMPSALISFGLTLLAFNQTAPIDYIQPWMTEWGANFHFSLDGLSKLMVLLTNGLIPFVLLSTKDRGYSKGFYALVMLMQMALNGVFMAQDGLLFYIFWELALIPVYFICLFWGGENRGRVTFKFFIYTLAGSLLMLLGLLFVYFKTQEFAGSFSFNINDLYTAGQQLTLTQQSWVFWAFFIAFAIKIPIFPFHTWQPDTYTTAPTPGVMLLAGIMLKMGTYGLIRWLMPLVPQGWNEWREVVMIMITTGIIYSSCIAIVQKDIKRLIAYSSIAHVGLISAGIFSTTIEGLQGAVFQMISHGIVAVGLFYIVDLLETRQNTRLIANFGGIRNVAPVFALCFLLVLLGSVALPLTNGFVGEFLLITGIFKFNSWMAAAAGLTVILGAVYMLRSYQNIILGETNAGTSGFQDLNSKELLFLFIIIAAIFIFGIFPNLLLSQSENTIQAILNIYQSGIK